VALLFCFERRANLLTHALNVIQIKAAVCVARRADANKRHFGITHCFGCVRRRAQALCRDDFIRQLADASLDNRALPALMMSILVWLTSTPITSWPSFAKHAAETHPTYPSPKTLSFIA
jgi:hypothetical protein